MRRKAPTVSPAWRGKLAHNAVRLAALLIAVGSLGLASPATAETRLLKLYHLHTGEKMEIVFKRDGKYDAAGLRKINRFLRDWRRNQPTTIDPRLLDLLWEVYRATNARDYINVLGGFRSPETNAMLRSRSALSGVAENSQHMLGKAIDFYIPGVPLEDLREASLWMQMGGVGYYPHSGSPFVHLDVGNARMWPRMSRRQLAAIFKDGKTLYIPSDGKPLPGYEEALASYRERLRSGTPATGGAPSLLASLFSKGKARPASETVKPADATTLKDTLTATAKPTTASGGSVDIASVAIPSPRPVPASSRLTAPQTAVDQKIATVSTTDSNDAKGIGSSVLAYNAQISPVATASSPAELDVVPFPHKRPSEAVTSSETTELGREPSPTEVILQAPPFPTWRPARDDGMIATIVPTPRPDLAATTAVFERDAGDAPTGRGRKAARYAHPDMPVPRGAAVARDRFHNPVWAFSRPRTIDVSGTAHERFASAYDRLNAKPALVLAEGFQQSGTEPVSDHFTGAAVQFLPVRRFSVD